MVRYLFISFFILLEISSISQNEAYHGGIGDGFGYQSVASFDLSQIGFLGGDLNLSINRALNQNDPTMQDPVIFNVTFNQSVIDFDISDIVVAGSANPQNIAITGSGALYAVQISGMTSNGDIVIDIPQGTVHNSVGNSNKSTTIIDNSVFFNGIEFNINIDIPITQKLISNSGIVHYKIDFAENVVDFTNDDVSLSGTANASIVSISGSGKSFDISVSGMTQNGTVIVNLPEGKVHNAQGAQNAQSINIQNTVNCDFTSPSVEIKLADGQLNPSFSNVLKFEMIFSESIQSLLSSNINLSGTAGANSIAISQHLNTYILSVSGMTQNGTVIVSLDAGRVLDLAGNGNQASINTQNQIVYENTEFAVEISLPSGQNKSTNNNTAAFNIKFNRNPVDFNLSDITIGGTAHANSVALTGSGTDFLLTFAGITNDGNIVINIEAGKVADEFSNTNAGSINLANEIIIDTNSPFASIELDPLQNNPSNKSELIFKVTFNEDVEDFLDDDIQVASTAGSISHRLEGSGSLYKVVVSGMDYDGDINLTIPSNVCKDLAGNLNSNTVTINNLIQFDNSNPSVEITQENGQEDPAKTLPLNFHVEFSEDVYEFGPDRIGFGGSSGVYLEVTGSGKIYKVSAFGLLENETILINIPAGVVHDLAGNHNLTSVNTDNSITYKETTGIGNLTDGNACKIYFSSGNINVEFDQIPDKTSYIDIFDIQGKLICSRKNLSQLNQIPINDLTMIYVIKVIDGNKKNNKVIIPVRN